VSLLRESLTTVVELIGCALIVAGLAMVSVPVSVIAAGVLAIGISFLVAAR